LISISYKKKKSVDTWAKIWRRRRRIWRAERELWRRRGERHIEEKKHHRGEERGMARRREWESREKRVKGVWYEMIENFTIFVI